MPELGLETGACKRSACKIQACLARNNYNEALCKEAIQDLRNCCKRLPPGSTSTHCSFDKK